MYGVKSFKNYLSFQFDILQMKRFKKKFFPPDIKILAITDLDCKYISTALSKNMIYTVPNGIHLQNFENIKSYKSKKYESHNVVFVGSLDYQPNIESILYTLENLWPEIHHTFPRLIFKIVGRSPHEELIKKIENSDGVELIGPVDNVWEYYKGAKCFLGPIFSGGGMKNKFLESFSVGTPVITTPEGAIGINMENDRHGKIGGTKSELLEAVFQMLSCSKTEYSMYIDACICLSSENSWEKAGALLNTILTNTSRPKKSEH